MNNNIFKSPVIVSRSHRGEELRRIENRGMRYYAEMKSASYLELSRNELKAFLEDAYSKQNDDGIVRLLVEEMPSDMKQIAWHYPTYAICVVSVYAFVNYPELFTEELKMKFKKLLDAAFRYGIVEHGGFDGYALEVLTALIKAGCRKIVEENRDLSERFSGYFEYNIERFAAAAGLDASFNQRDDWDKIPVDLTALRIIGMWTGKHTPVFVYGSLKKKERAAHFLDGAIFAGYYQLKGYKMINLGSYPGIIESEKGTVLGEVYFVENRTLDMLDRYESNGSLYKRKKLWVSGDFGRIQAEAYVYGYEKTDAKECGNLWKLEDKDYVWYAAYGSNLDPVRFTLYILGGKLSPGSKKQDGCPEAERILWIEDKTDRIPGKVYFANSSSRWKGKGVAFFDPDGKGYAYVHKYKITYSQLKCVWEQEGNNARWYDNLQCLGISRDGCAVYTITSSGYRPANEPDESYLSILEKALKKEFRLTKKEIGSYLKSLLS